MSTLTIFSPVSAPQTDDAPAARIENVPTLQGKRVGFLWGMHDLTIMFWPVLEEEVIATVEPSEIHRHHKTDAGDGVFKGNTWIPAPLEQINELSPHIDWALCGVGA
jgi:hypothetical protein